MTIRETRSVAAAAAAEVRAAADEATTLSFTGHAAVFNQRTWIGPKRWGFWEEIAEGFFDDVLDDDAAFLVNHDPSILLARSPGTLKLSVDKVGLVADADWDPADPDAVKWAGRVQRLDATQMSFAFTVAEEKWSEDADGFEIRTLLKCERLYDVSLVTYPAYEGTDAGMRGYAAAAEVVKAHRGVDPRDLDVRERPLVILDKTASDADVEAVKDELQRSTDVQSSVRALRHRGIAARYGLTL